MKKQARNQLGGSLLPLLEAPNRRSRRVGVGQSRQCTPLPGALSMIAWLAQWDAIGESTIKCRTVSFVVWVSKLGPLLMVGRAADGGWPL